MHRISTLLTVIGAAVTIGCSSADSATPAKGHAPEPIAVAQSAGEVIAADLPPLPAGVATAARPATVVKLAYEFAARHPEVLNYVPCFCGCEADGHKGNHDCFVGERDGQGRVVAWDAHGIHCAVCIDVATMARQMHDSGASVMQIRTAVEKHFAVPGGGHTPTPAPPSDTAARN